ncbi:hypothetical protein OSB04_006416 [Centaurea solstitialis]|uniref:Zinc finger, CCHC-type n=1 Tax=Centaurea solstitialis TaxID=347529 RepID=A0AA38TVP6_9ASTR|nr:hypothetical protein OSB04_006416 [Centaurea solstitialis]
MSFQEAVGRLKAYEERINKPNKEEDTHDGLLYAKTNGKKEDKEHSCERCGYRKLNQDTKEEAMVEIGNHGGTKMATNINKTRVR